MSYRNEKKGKEKKERKKGGKKEVVEGRIKRRKR